MPSVLIVDDDEVVLKLMCKALEKAEISTLGTTNPGEALDLLQEERFELLLTDLVMEGIDGVELFRRAREEHPLLRGLCFSGFLSPTELRRIVCAGFDDALIKPVRRQELVPAVLRCLELRTHWLKRIESVNSDENNETSP